MQEIIINKNDSGQRLDKFLTKKFKTLPFSLMYKLIRKKKITINRKRAKENQILCEGDLILIFSSDEIFSAQSKSNKVSTGKIDVVYEDENIIIVDKEEGLIVHSDTDDDSDNLIGRITNYLINRNEYFPENENSFAPALCNRIDRNTQGLVIAAKNAQALREMNFIIKERFVHKTYLAVVHGIVKPEKGEITLFLEKDTDANIVKVRNRANSKTKTAITRYKRIAISRDNRFSLLEIDLVTGRTHQIRATFAHIGHPLLGDGKYAVNKKDREMGYTSQALCAFSLTFDGCKKCEALSYLDGLTVEAKKPRFLNLF